MVLPILQQPHTQVLVSSLERAYSWSLAVQSVWRCVNTHTWVLPASALFQLFPDSVSTLLPHQPVICLGRCVLKIYCLLQPCLTLWDNWRFGAHKPQVPSRAGVCPVSWGVGAEPEPCTHRARKLQAQRGTSGLWSRGCPVWVLCQELLQQREPSVELLVGSTVSRVQLWGLHMPQQGVTGVLCHALVGGRRWGLP